MYTYQENDHRPHFFMKSLFMTINMVKLHSYFCSGYHLTVPYSDPLIIINSSFIIVSTSSLKNIDIFYIVQNNEEITGEITPVYKVITLEKKLS